MAHEIKNKCSLGKINTNEINLVTETMISAKNVHYSMVKIPATSSLSPRAIQKCALLFLGYLWQTRSNFYRATLCVARSL